MGGHICGGNDPDTTSVSCDRKKLHELFDHIQSFLSLYVLTEMKDIETVFDHWLDTEDDCVYLMLVRVNPTGSCRPIWDDPIDCVHDRVCWSVASTDPFSTKKPKAWASETHEMLRVGQEFGRSLILIPHDLAYILRFFRDERYKSTFDVIVKSIEKGVRDCCHGKYTIENVGGNSDVKFIVRLRRS